MMIVLYILIAWFTNIDLLLIIIDVGVIYKSRAAISKIYITEHIFLCIKIYYLIMYFL